MSPISRAASHRFNIAGRSGRIDTNVGSMSNHFAQRIRNKATAVRELESIAIDRIAVVGLLVKMATDATGPFEVTAMSGTT